jgi:hypothetical protein
VNQTERAGAYTVRLVVDPSTPGANELRLHFLDPGGRFANEVTNATATLTSDGGAPRPLALRLITAGHFVADTDMSTRGPWRLTVDALGAPSPLSATFRFSLPGRGSTN